MKLRLIYTVVFLQLVKIPSQCQEHINWDILADVKWIETTDSITNEIILTGEFGAALKQFNGKEVYISGYAIPLDAMGFSYALSRSSYASCFFCGQAGPETVMELKVTPRAIPAHQQNNTLLKFKGTLVLKENNPTGLNYILEKASLIP